MNQSIFNTEALADLEARIGRLSNDSIPNWGKMNANQMLCHLSDQIRVALGQRRVKRAVPALFTPLIRMMVLTGKDWKPNQPTFKPFLQGEGGDGTPPVNFESDRKTLLDLLAKLSSTPANFQFGIHPGLGRLNREQYGFFVWKHLDHHLRQFGV